MILKASQRRNGKNLALHLQRGDTNEHVTIHELRGFVSDDIIEAFQEAKAFSMATQCEQYLFSLSLNPPEEECVKIESFEDAIEQVENALGLTDQPRAIVFHEKNGRRHCHCVWSRIFHDGKKFKAVNMAHFKRKLNTIAKDLFLKHNWALPKGFLKKKTVDQPDFNYALPEWQQAERLKESPEGLKAFFASCWNGSDNKQSFAAALQESGYFLARGDRRGYVAVDYQGEVYSLSRWLKVKTKELKAKLGDHTDLPSADQAKDYAESRMSTALKQYLTEMRARAKEQRAPLVQELRELVNHQRKQRKELLARQRKRWEIENKDRIHHFRSGIGGLWDMISGTDAEIRTRNREEAKQARARDRTEMEEMVEHHLRESRELHKTLKFYKEEQRKEEWRLKRQMAAFLNTETEPEHVQEVQAAITEKLAELEHRITEMSGDIAAMQDALDDAMISDDMKAKIRAIIERTKEAFIWKKIKEEQAHQKKQKATEAQLIETQQRLFQSIQRYEQLRQQQADHQRQIAANTAFHARIMAMPYSLNGIPMHPVKINDPPLDMKRYQQTLSGYSAATLVKTVKTKPPKGQVLNAAELRMGTATVSDILKRSRKKQKTERHSRPAHTRPRII